MNIVVGKKELTGRGPEDKLVDSECPECGSVYFDAAISHAQAIHDREEKCCGKLIIIT